MIVARHFQYTVVTHVSSTAKPDRDALQKVLASTAFANAERMRRFLEFVVEHTLSSPNEHLKEMIIRIELYRTRGI